MNAGSRNLQEPQKPNAHDLPNLQFAMKQRQVLLVFLCVLTSSLIGCYRGYQLDIDQGNVITLEKVSQLQLGMTREAVQFVMGTPLVKDPFHLDRWDYFYSFTSGNKRTASQKQLTIFFENNILTDIRQNDSELKP